MILNHSEAQALIICSFRYALGRRSYVVSEICEIIKNKIGYLDYETVKLIYWEIQDAINAGNAGDQMDVVEWEKLKAELHDRLF